VGTEGGWINGSDAGGGENAVKMMFIWMMMGGGFIFVQGCLSAIFNASKARSYIIARGYDVRPARFTRLPDSARLIRFGFIAIIAAGLVRICFDLCYFQDVG
jgi:hypothetical protein